MAELRRELVGNKGKALDRIIGNVDERTSDSLVVVVDAFNGEVVVTGTLSADRRPDANPDTARRGDSRTQERRVQNAKASRSARRGRRKYGEFRILKSLRQIGARRIKRHTG